jgi:hypothetical protein
MHTYQTVEEIHTTGDMLCGSPTIASTNNLFQFLQKTKRAQRLVAGRYLPARPMCHVEPVPCFCEPLTRSVFARWPDIM